MAEPTQTANLDDERARADPRIPVRLITGKPGSEKADFIKQIVLTSPPGITNALVLTGGKSWARFSRNAEAITPTMVTAPCGTIVCFADNDVKHALYQLHLHRLGLLDPQIDYDQVLVDLGEDYSTGDFAAQVLNDDRIDASYRLEQIITLVDNNARRKDLVERRQEQIGEADTIIFPLAHDIHSDENFRALAEIAGLNPLACLKTAQNFSSSSNAAWRIPLGSFGRETAKTLISETGMIRIEQDNGPATCLVGNFHNNSRSNLPTDLPPIRVMRMSIPGQMNLARFTMVLNDLIKTCGPNILRLAAVVNARHAELPMAFDVIGGTLLRPAFSSDQPRNDSDICIVARGLDAKEAIRAFNECVWAVPGMAGPIEKVN